VSCTCQECGHRYRVDIDLPDVLWDRIRPAGKEPGAGMLCGACIVQRIEGLGEYGVLRIIAAEGVADFAGKE